MASSRLRRAGPAARRPWFFDVDPSWWDSQPPVAIEHFTRHFSTIERSLAGFSDAQIAQGLTYLLSTSASGDNGWFYSRATPIAARLRCIEAIEGVFAELFAPRGAQVMGHIDELDATPLNTVCYVVGTSFRAWRCPTIRIAISCTGQRSM